MLGLGKKRWDGSSRRDEQAEANARSARLKEARVGELVDYNPKTGETRPLTRSETRVAERNADALAKANAKAMDRIEGKNGGRWWG